MTNTELSYDEVALLLELMGEVELSKFNTTSRKNVLRKLLAVTENGDSGTTSVCFTGVAPASPVEAIKTIRILTGFGLKEAKDLYDSLDPFRNGGTIGPFKLPGTFDDGVAVLKAARAEGRTNGTIRLSLA